MIHLTESGPAEHDPTWNWLIDRWRAIPTAVLAFLPCLAIAALILPSLGQRSLWLDEAGVANAVLRGYFDPYHMATTPVGLVALVAVLVRFTEPNEFWFRLFPFLFGLGSLLLIFFTARYFFRSRLEAALAVTLLATNVAALSYFRTLKPYAADMFFTLLIVLLAERIASRGTTATWVAYALASVAAPFFSFPSVFVIAVSSTVLLSAALRRGHPLKIRSWLMAHSVAAIAFGINTLLFLWSQRTYAVNSTWDSGFAPRADPFVVIAWYAQALRDVLEYFFVPVLDPFSSGAILVFAVLAGAYSAAKTAPRQVVLLGGPLAAAAVAAFFNSYPLEGSGGRVLLFVLPGLLVLGAAGLAALVRAAASTRVIGVGILLVMIVVISGLQAIKLSSIDSPLVRPYTLVEEVRDLVERDMRPGLRDGDLAYVYYGAADAFQFYAPEFRQQALAFGEYRVIRQDGVELVFGGIHRDDLPQYEAELRSITAASSPRRVWLLFGHTRPAEEEALVSALSKCGEPEFDKRQPGASLYRIRVLKPGCVEPGQTTQQMPWP